MKLQTKLIIAFASIVILMASLQSIFFQQRVERDFEEYISQNETEKIEFWKDLLIDYYLYYGTLDGIQEVLEESNIGARQKRGYMGGNNYFLPMLDNFEIVVVDTNGVVIGDTESQLLGESAKDISGLKESLEVDGVKIGEMIVYRGKTIGFLTIEQQFIKSMNTSIILSTIIAVIIAVIIGIFISGKITKPLEKLMIGIKHISRGDTSYRVKVDTRDEFHKLANAFNDMSQKIQQNEEVRRSLVADVAHELRTPLSILGGRLESIQEGVLEPSQEVIVQLNDEVFRLSRLVDDLQQLGLAEAGKLPLNKRLVNLNDLIQKVIYHFSWLAEEKNINIKLISTDDIIINVDPDRITQVIINILGNALRHSPENEEVELLIDRENNDVVIKIEDNGQGIDPEQLPYIFERFYRTDSSRSRDQGGTGLGLSIAKGFVEAHGGTILVESEKGNGTAFIISLPIEVH